MQNTAQRVFAYNGGLLWRHRKLLRHAGLQPVLGYPKADDTVAIWGDSPTAWRGKAIAQRTGAKLIRIEDAWLRSLHPGRKGEAPLGLLIDDLGIHFDPHHPSRIEHILAQSALDAPRLLARAEAGIERMRHAHLSKYAAHDLSLTPPESDYVLVVDQTLNDASVRVTGGDRAAFQHMLDTARREHPNRRIIIKTHPETAHGFRRGYFDQSDLASNIDFCTDSYSPWVLLKGAAAVYVYSSQMGFEAILAGHTPIVFGQPLYAGWGLSDDRAAPIARRTRKLSPAQLFAGAMIEAPIWRDPHNDCIGKFEDALGALEAQARAWHEDRQGWRAHGVRLWKRGQFQKFFGRHKPVKFAGAAPERRHMVWGANDAPAGSVRIEDGFLRSKGLGAALIPPLSLGLDDLGIHYDPAQESRLERFIAEPDLTAHQRDRANQLIQTINTLGLSKYNLGTTPPPLPKAKGQKIILVVGQVADDASITYGGNGANNENLLRAARAAHPNDVLLWKPHPDVEAGLRPGHVIEADKLADLCLTNVDPAQLLPHVDHLWTICSGFGFEALMRGVPVTCLGSPFYSGWGLTTDLGPEIARRTARPDLACLVHRTLIDYPRYFDPVSELPCSVEQAIIRLTENQKPRRHLRLLSKAQGLLASQSWLWR